jgi:hypothetical protein
MSTDKRQPPRVDEVAPLVYEELRRLAAACMRRERPGQTLQATALVNEAYRLLAGARTPWTDKRHFVGMAARDDVLSLLADHSRRPIAFAAGRRRRARSARGRPACAGHGDRHLHDRARDRTEWFNRVRLAKERQRTRRAMRLLDVLTAVLLFVDAVIIAGVKARTAVFALSAALGLALASLVIEPATTAAAFGEDA